MLGLYGTLSYAVCVYLCICVSVFVYLCMRHLVISVLISLDQALSENIWFVWSKSSFSGDKKGCDARGQRTDGHHMRIFAHGCVSMRIAKNRRMAIPTVNTLLPLPMTATRTFR